MKKYIYLFILLLLMVLIFSFSAKDKEESSGDSHRVAIWVGKLVIQDFEKISPEKQEEFIELVEFPIRKGAHASEYALLAVLTFLTVESWRDEIESLNLQIHKKDRKKQPGTKKMMLISWMIATAYAATDEFHQLFVPGRSGQIIDVCIDSMGAVTGLLLMLALMVCWKRMMEKKKRNEQEKEGEGVNIR